jgi:hypothetical protein
MNSKFNFDPKPIINLLILGADELKQAKFDYIYLQGATLMACELWKIVLIEIWVLKNLK